MSAMGFENIELREKLQRNREEILGLGKNREAGEPIIDLRLEVVLAELINQGLDPLKDVLIHTWSVFERDYRSDLDLEDERVIIGDARSLDKEKKRVKIGSATTAIAKEEKPSEWDYDDMMRQALFLNLVTHRDGLYDYLPEGLFHQPVSKNRDRDSSDWSHEIAEQFEREQGARRFFQPIEQEFYHQRLFLELEERKYLLTEENLRQNDEGELFRDFWRLPSGLFTIRQLNNLLHLLPVAHRITGDLELMADVFALILGVPVTFALLPPLSYPIQDQSLAVKSGEAIIESEPDDLGRLCLGSFSLGGLYQDTMPAMEIRIGPLSAEQFVGFAPGGNSRQLLNLLEGYFIPAETTVVSHLIPDLETQFICLPQERSMSILGFNAYL